MHDVVRRSCSALRTWRTRLPLWDQRAASVVEYALLVALIALVLISAVTFLGGSTSGSLNRSSSSLFG